MTVIQNILIADSRITVLVSAFLLLYVYCTDILSLIYLSGKGCSLQIACY